MGQDDFSVHRFHKPVAMNDLLESFRQDDLIGPAVRCSKLLDCWEDVVGVRFARKVKPIEVKRSVLTVLVPNSAWAHEFTCFSDSVRRNIKKFVGMKVDKIRCKLDTNGG